VETVATSLFTSAWNTSSIEGKKGGREGGREEGRKGGRKGGRYLEVLPRCPVGEIRHLQPEVSARAPSTTPTAEACHQPTDREGGMGIIEKDE